MRLPLINGILAGVALVIALMTYGARAGGTPLGTAFTYQGILKQAGAPVDDMVDLEFRLFDVATAGAALGTLAFHGVDVVNGLLTIDLDFGSVPGAFDGSERWLEVAVDGTTLEPRQRIAVAPYALYAINAPAMSLPYNGSGNFNGPLLSVTNAHGNGRALAGYATAPGFNFPQAVGVYGHGSGDNGRGVQGVASGPMGFGVYGSNTGSGPGVRGDSQYTGVYGEAVATGGRGVHGKWNGLFTGPGDGGFFESINGNGVRAGGTVGLHADGSTDGVRGYGNENGVYGELFDSDGTAVYGKCPNGGIGVWGQTTNGTAVGGQTSSGTAVYGSTFSGTGVHGTTSAGSGGAFYGTTYGVYGSGTNNYGVYGQGGATGVYGHGWDVGVWGQGGNWAGNFIGKVYISGNLGLGLNPWWQLQLSSNSAAKPGGGSWGDWSDARLKKNIEPIEHALDDLLALRGVTYQWIDPAEHGDMTGTYPGMIAQDVEKVFPEWVTQDVNGFKAVTVIGFEGLVVEALRELRVEKDAQIDQQSARIAALEAENANIRERLEKLERLMLQTR